MASDNQKKVLIDVEIGDSESIKKLANLRKHSDDLKKAQKELDRTTEEGRQKYEEYAIEIQKANGEIRTLQNEIKKTDKAQNAESNSIEQLQVELSLATAEYNKMSDAMRESAEGKELQKFIKETSDSLKVLKSDLGDNRMEVGSYQEAIENALGENSKFKGTLQGIDSALPGVGKGFSDVTQKIIGTTKATFALLASPIVLFFAAIISVALLLGKAFQRSEDNMNKVNVVGAKLGAVFQWLLKALEPVASFIVDGLLVAFDKLAESIEWVLDKLAMAMDFFGMESAAKFVRATTAEVKEMSKAAGELTKAELELTKAQREAQKVQLDYQKKAEKLRQLRDDESKSIGERIKANEELGLVLKEQLSEELKIAQKALDVAKMRAMIYGDTAENLDKVAEAQTRISDIQERITGQESEQLSNLNSLRKEAADKAYESMLSTLEAKQKVNESMLKAESDYQSEDFAKRQAYEYKLFNLQQNSEIEKLNFQLKYGKIRKDEFDAECKILLAEQRAFNGEQLKLAEQYQEGIRKNLFEILNLNVDNQILDVERKYAEAFKQLGEIKLPVFQEGMDVDLFSRDYERAEQLILERAQIEVELENQKQKEISEIRKQYIETRSKDIEELVAQEYENDLAKFSDNEKEKVRIQIEQQKQLIDEKKKAGLQTYEDEAELRGLQSRENQLALNMDLLQVNLNAKQRYDLVKSMLEQEQELYEGNALKQLEIGQALMENERTMLEERAKAFEDWSSSTMDLLSGLNSFISELESAELQEFEIKNEQKKEKLKERLDKGYISQKEYDQKVKELDKEAEKQKAEIARKSAIREKAMNAFQIGIDTTMGIMKAVAASPLTFGLPWSAFVAATGALQLAAVLAKPIPKAARGRLITGPAHAAGGTLIEAEGGEAVINKRSVSMFAPLLSAINEAGGGIPFARPLSDGGYSIRNSSASKNATIEEMQTAFSNAISQLQVIATIEDIRRGDSNYLKIQDRATY